MTWDDLTWEQKRGAVLASALFVCEMCQTADATEVDHIWPKSKGGPDSRENLRATCRPCNREKGDAIYIADLDADRTRPSIGAHHYKIEAETAAFDAIRWGVILRLMVSGRDARAADQMAHLVDAAVARVVHVVHDLIDEITDRLYDGISTEPPPLSLPALPEGLPS